VAVEGARDQLYAEAKGALEAEGFRPVGAHGEGLGVRGSSLAEGRLQFLYWADNIAPTVVEVRIEPGDAKRYAAATSSETHGTPAGTDGSRSARGTRTADAAGRGSDATAASAEPLAGSEHATPTDPAQRVVTAGAVAGGPEDSATASARARTAAARKAQRDSTPHSVAVSAWSSLTFAPDPWIADLAVVALRRAYLLSGNIR
jgi:hypothetical protein